MELELEAEEEEVAVAELFGCVRDGEGSETASFINEKKNKTKAAGWRCARCPWIKRGRGVVPCARFVGVWQA